MTAGPPIADAAGRRRCDEAIAIWASEQLAGGATALVAVDRDEERDRWYLRFRGDEKDFVTVWLTARQRTLYHEAQVMPAPETNVRQTWELFLRRNAHLPQMRFALGPEDAVYLVGEVAVAAVDAEELDRILGGTVALVDEIFPTAMAIGYAGRYRRRRRRPAAP